MSEQSEIKISQAFDALLQTLESEINSVNELGIKSFEARNYENARSAADRAARLNSFEPRLTELRSEWSQLLAGEPIVPGQNNESANKQSGPPIQGQTDPAAKAIWQRQTTPEDQFYQPILQAMVEMGGSAKEDDVLNQIGEKMKEVFNQVDLNAVPNGDPNVPIWRITALWARGSLVQAGLIKVDSRKKFWEITDKGRAAASVPQPVQAG